MISCGTDCRWVHWRLRDRSLQLVHSFTPPALPDSNDPSRCINPAYVHAVAHSPCARLSAVALGDGRLALWQSAARSVLQTLDAHPGAAAVALCFAPGGAQPLLFSGGTDARLCAFRPAGALVRRAARSVRLWRPAAAVAHRDHVNWIAPLATAGAAHQRLWSGSLAVADRSCGLSVYGFT